MPNPSSISSSESAGPRSRTRSYGWFLAGFFLGAAALVAGLNHFERTRFEVPPRTIDLPISGRLIDRRAWYPGKAKRMGLFWTSDLSGAGTGVDLFRSPELFETVFPGYARAIGDRRVWDAYFREPFLNYSYDPALTRPGSEIVVWTSWTGNLDLYAGYGAGVVVLGNSQSWALSPGLLAGDFASAGAKDLTSRGILSLASAGMNVSGVDLAVDGLRSSGRKARVAVLGYSLDFLRAPPAGASGAAAGHETAGAFYAKWRRGSSWLTSKLDSVRRLLDWNKILWLNEDSLAADWKRMTGRVETRLVAGRTVEWDAVDREWRFPPALAGDEAALESVASATPIDRSGLPAFDPSRCDLDGESARLDGILAKLKASADAVVLYLPPTAPLHENRWPACLVDGTRKMLESKAGPRVIVDAGDWKSYGLDYRDFAVPVFGGGADHFDAAHLNFGGATKVSRVLSGLILKASASVR